MRVLLLLLTFVLMVTEGYTQTGSPRPMSPPRPKAIKPTRKATSEYERRRQKRPLSAGSTAFRALPFSQTLSEIKEGQPALSTVILYQDREAVEASLPAISYILKKKGFNEDDAGMAAAAGWRHLRAEKLSPETPLSPKDLINFVDNIGKLIIKSDPEGAEVEVEGKKLPQRTVAVAWCTAGQHRVRLVKQGYIQVEGVCEVKKDEATDCVIKLIPVQQ